jgi:hypothetical protein
MPKKKNANAQPSMRRQSNRITAARAAPTIDGTEPEADSAAVHTTVHTTSATTTSLNSTTACASASEVQQALPVDPRLEEFRAQWEKELREKIAAERASRDTDEPTHAEKERPPVAQPTHGEKERPPVAQQKSSPSLVQKVPSQEDKAPESEAKTTGRRPQIKWTAEMTTVMLRSLVKQIRLGKRSDNGFKAEVWATVANDVLAFDASQPFLDGPRCQSKLDALKKKYDAWNRIKGRSGFGWDNERGVPTAPEDVWETAIQVSILEPWGARLLTVRGRKLRSSKSSGTHHFQICRNLAKSWTVSEPLASGLSIPGFLLLILFSSIICTSALASLS